jgi:CRP/FNR family cyclic AMP-dependent transcriptional regulator
MSSARPAPAVPRTVDTPGPSPPRATASPPAPASPLEQEPDQARLGLIAEVGQRVVHEVPQRIGSADDPEGWARIYRVLAATPVFRHLSRAQVLRMSRTARCRRYEPGATLAPEVMAGVPVTTRDATRLFVIAAGWCTASRSLPDGRRVIVGIRGARQIAGIERLARLAPGPRTQGTPESTFTWRSLLDLPSLTAAGWVEAIQIPADELLSLVRLDPAARDDADGLARERITELEALLLERCLDTPDRLLRVLRRLALRFGRATALGHVLDLPLDQTELAALVGSTRESVNRALRKLSAHGVVTLWEGRPLLIRPDLRSNLGEQMRIG